MVPTRCLGGGRVIEPEVVGELAWGENGHRLCGDVEQVLSPEPTRLNANHFARLAGGWMALAEAE